MEISGWTWRRLICQRKSSFNVEGDDGDALFDTNTLSCLTLQTQVSTRAFHESDHSRIGITRRTWYCL